MPHVLASPICPPATVVVTGANGFIASHTISVLLQHGFRVLGTVRSASKAEIVQKTHARLNPKLVHLLTTGVVEDITTAAAYTQLFREHQPTAILHMASPFGYSTTNFERDLMQPAVNGTKAVLYAASKTPSVRRVIHTNSFACVFDASLGPRRGYVYTAQDFSPLTYAQGVAAPNAAVAYRASKAVAEQTAYTFLEEKSPNFDFVSMCPAMVFGPFLNTDFSIPETLDQLNTSNQLVWDVISAGEESEMPPTKGPVWIDVRDVAKAHVRALTDPNMAGKRLLLAKGLYCSQEIADLARELVPKRKSRIPVGHYGRREAHSHFGVDASVEESELAQGKWLELKQSLQDLIPQLYQIEARASDIERG